MPKQIGIEGNDFVENGLFASGHRKERTSASSKVLGFTRRWVVDEHVDRLTGGVLRSPFLSRSKFDILPTV